MTQVTINSVSGFVLPFSGAACNIYGNQCQSIGVITSLPTIITLPSPEFDTAPAFGLLLIDSTGCQVFQVLDCQIDPQKQFQDGDVYDFMDYEIFQFQ
jgi:hypothetical protein